MANQVLPEGRPLTFGVIVWIGVTSAAFNVYGALQFFPGWGGNLFAAAILGVELFALLALKHIVEDWSNRHYEKAVLASVMFALAIVGCAASGHRAFDTLVIEVRETNKAAEMRRDRLLLEIADAEDRKDFTAANAKQRSVDAISLELEKNRLPEPWLIWAFLALWELLKSCGRYAVATLLPKGLTLKQRRQHGTPGLAGMLVGSGADKSTPTGATLN